MYGIVLLRCKRGGGGYPTALTPRECFHGLGREGKNEKLLDIKLGKEESQGCYLALARKFSVHSEDFSRGFIEKLGKKVMANSGNRPCSPE